MHHIEEVNNTLPILISETASNNNKNIVTQLISKKPYNIYLCVMKHKYFKTSD